jgi:hypothetical protein
MFLDITNGIEATYFNASEKKRFSKEEIFSKLLGFAKIPIYKNTNFYNKSDVMSAIRSLSRRMDIKSLKELEPED